MKKLLGIVLVLCVSVFSLNLKPVNAREAFDIRFHDVEMEVHEDGSIRITETMGVHFNEQRHGIYVNLREKQYMTMTVNGVTSQRQYYFPITDIKVLSSQSYDISEGDSFYQIRMGDANFYANEDETYKWEYVFHTRDLGFDGLQMLFMNLVDDYAWDTDTESCSFMITMPKPFDPEKISMASPEGMMYGTGTKGNLTVEVMGNVIRGSYKGLIQNNEGLTINVMLDNDYFKFEDFNRYGTISSIISGILAIIAAVVFFIVGKDERLIQTVEFNAPEGLNSAEVGTIIDEEPNVNDVVSLILDWGRKGYITIEETEDNLILHKVKDADEYLEGYERSLFEGVFRGKETRNVSSMKNSFYKKIERCQEDIRRKFNRKTTKLISDGSKIAQIVMTPLCAIPMCLIMILCWYRVYREIAPMIVLSVAVTIAISIGVVITSYYVKKKYINKLLVKILLLIGAIIFFAFPVFALTLVLEHLKIKPVYTIITIVLTIIMVLVTSFMKKRTPYGNEMLGKVTGLREFIRVAEEDRLKALQEEDPMYFYNILPYAYAFGLTNVWNDHFKNIAIPDCTFYSSYSPYSDRYHMVHSLESNVHSVGNTMTSRPSESSGGGSFSSGGGGGGSSFSGGGGFGGSSGGSW